MYGMYKLYVVTKGRETNGIIDVLFMSFRIYRSFNAIPENFRITVLLDFTLTVRAAPHECVIRTSQL